MAYGDLNKTTQEINEILDNARLTGDGEVIKDLGEIDTSAVGTYIGPIFDTIIDPGYYRFTVPIYYSSGLLEVREMKWGPLPIIVQYLSAIECQRTGSETFCRNVYAFRYREVRNSVWEPWRKASIDLT